MASVCPIRSPVSPIRYQLPHPGRDLLDDLVAGGAIGLLEFGGEGDRDVEGADPQGRGLEGGEVDHGVDVLLAEDAIQQGRITNVPLIEEGFTPADGGDASQNARLAVAEVIHHHRRITIIDKLHTYVAANKTGSTGHKNRSARHERFLINKKPQACIESDLPVQHKGYRRIFY